MKTMTWEEIDKDWAGLQKRHRLEIAEAVARYCVGHKMDEVGDRLGGYRIQWVQEQLNYAGFAEATKGDAAAIPLEVPRRGENKNAHVIRPAVNRVISEFAPDVKIKLSGKGGNQKIESVSGEDAEEFGPYLDHYIGEGHEPAAATRLAKAEWAAESAVEAGVIKETKNKRDEKVNQILFPEDAKDTFELDLKMHMSRVLAAARFLDTAKMNHLRRKATCERVTEANEKWVEQVDRILNLHPTLNR